MTIQAHIAATIDEYEETRLLCPAARMARAVHVRESPDGMHRFSWTDSTPTVAVIEVAPNIDPTNRRHETGHAFQFYADRRALDLGLGPNATTKAAWVARRFTITYEEAMRRYAAAGSPEYAWHLSPLEWTADCLALAKPHVGPDAYTERILTRGGLFTDAELAQQPPLDRVAMWRFFTEWLLDQNIAAYWARIKAMPATARFTGPMFVEWCDNVAGVLERDYAAQVQDFKDWSSELQVILDRARVA